MRVRPKPLKLKGINRVPKRQADGTVKFYLYHLRIPTKSPGCTDMKSPGDSETMSPTFPI